MAGNRVRTRTKWRQPALPGVLEQVGPLVAAAGAVAGGDGTTPAGAWEARRSQAAAVAQEALAACGAGGVAQDWEAACFAAGCRFARVLAAEALAQLETRLHAARPVGYTVEGWRERHLVTRMGELRVRRRLYRAPDGTAHLLLDEHLGWVPRVAATPDLTALLVEWATRVPYRVAVHQLGQATAGVLGASTLWRLVQAVVARVTAAERAAHATWAETGHLPWPAGEPGERVVPVLYVEADGVWVKTQREPAYRTGYELKCASAYEGWQWLGGPTPGHPRSHYRLLEKWVYCHGFARADAQAPRPFWDLVDLHLARTYDASRIPVVVVGGDGANWLDTGLEHFPQGVRQRDGFHLARDAARGWGTATGATLYAAVRAGDQATAAEVLALPTPLTPLTPPMPPTPPTPSPPRRAAALPPPPAPDAPAPDAPAPDAPAPLAVAVGSTETTHATWSVSQVARARAAFTGQVRASDAAVDWRLQVPPELVPPDARALGTQEGTNAHLLAKRMKHRGMAWTCHGARALAKASELATNGGSDALAPWCHRPATPLPARPRAPGGFAPAGPLPWPQVRCPDALGPLTAPIAAALHRLDTGARQRHRLR